MAAMIQDAQKREQKRTFSTKIYLIKGLFTQTNEASVALETVIRNKSMVRLNRTFTVLKNRSFYSTYQNSDDRIH